MAMPHTYQISKYASQLAESEAPMTGTCYFEHDFGEYSLEARVLLNRRMEWPHVMWLHGANSDYSWANSLNFALHRMGVSILSPILSGHSKASPVALEDTNLGNNIAEAEAFFSYLDTDRPKVIMASSMGATAALKLLERHIDEIEKLVLFGPCVYDKNSYNQNFGEPFREVIRRPYSYLKNDTLRLLKKFSGKVLLIKGQYDGLDPKDFGLPDGGAVAHIMIDGQKRYSPVVPETIETIHNLVPAERLTFIEVPDADHGVLAWMRDHPDEADGLVGQVARFISQ
jgi:pimeloyl-ACP methyl ester carboxylesterase